MPGKHYDLDTDVTLSGNDDKVIASQKATKTYVDTEVDKKADPTIIRDTNSDISVKELVINRLTNEEYDVAVKEDDQLYLTPDTTDQDIADAVSAHNTSNSAHSTLFNAKQDKLATQTAYTSKGTASKVPQITTNTLGQVTNITEVDIAHQSIKTLKTDNTTGQTASSSEAIAGSGTINLHKVSKTGSYSDLLNKPAINDGTLKIQVEGTDKNTFTANQSTDTTINITKDDFVQTKTYTGLIGTVNNQANATFYFMTVRPTSWNAEWSVRYRIEANLDDGLTPTNYQYFKSNHECFISGRQGVYTVYANFNSISSTSYRPIYYIINHKTTEAGYNAGYGTKLGVDLTSANSNLDTNYKRTIKITVLYTVNCSVVMNDAPEIPPNSSRTDYNKLSSTYYTTSDANSAGNWTRLNGQDNGLQESGDANTTYGYLVNTVNTGATKIDDNGYGARYSLIFATTPLNTIDERWSSLVNSSGNGTAKTALTALTFYIDRHPQYVYSANIAAGAASANALYQDFNATDVRYTCNTNNTYVTALKKCFLYLKDFNQSNMSFKSDATIGNVFTLDKIATRFPSSTTGDVYIYFLGWTTSTWYNFVPAFTQVHRIFKYTPSTGAMEEFTRDRFNQKQDKLDTQTAYSAKGSATKVPQITTNSLGQVTNISEVTITQPTVNDKTITIQKNSTTVDSFTLNQSTDKTINISVPTTVAELSDASDYVQTSSLEEAATVAKTGDYNDLINKPTIPTVNNATITIQKNSTTVDTFTLNQSSNKSINITVPTKTSDITNDSGFLTSHQSIKTLKTDNTTGQTASSSEAINGSGTINLHKISKTGSYDDLLNKPTIPTTTDSVTSGSTAALTSGGAYTNLVRRKSTTAATGGANQGVYVDANGQVQACNATTSTYSSTGTTAVNGTAVASALQNYIPKVIGTASTSSSKDSNNPQVAYGGTYYNGFLNNIKVGAAAVDCFEGAYLRGATVTCSYDSVRSGLGNALLNGTFSGYYDTINPSTSFEENPFIWEITKTTSFEASDVSRLYIGSHRMWGGITAKKFKIEVAYSYSSANGFSWTTVIDYDSETNFSLTNRFYGLFNQEVTESYYYNIYGIRLTISKSASTLLNIAHISLYAERGTSRFGSSIYALNTNFGGTVYSNITIPTDKGSFVGNLTGTATKATKDGDNNTISSTYLKLAGGTMTGGLKFGTSAIPQETNPLYMLSMDAFASGGAVKWVSVANIKAGKDGDGNTISSTYVKTANLPTKLSDFTDDLGSSPVHTHSQYQPSGNYISYTNNTATVAGTSKTVSKTNPETLYVPDGLIMGGTAQAAGLVTRGICGVSTPTSTGAATKDNLFINYDGNNTYSSSRQLVLQAGNVGTHYGNNLYQYAAARGDAVKNYADATYAAKATSLSGYGITDAYTKTEVDGMISSVYKPAGSVAFASLPTLASGVLGNVYNVTDAFTTTANFVEGAGKSYPAGTNVVVVNTGTTASPTYKFDVLAGFVDLSGYVPTSRKVNGKALSADITISKSDVGLGNVDNTSDSDKPISTATQTALDGKENTISDLNKIRSGANSFYVKGTQTASTNAFTGVLNAVSELYEGLTIDYWLPFAGTSTAATLNLTLAGGTTTGAVNCYYAGTTRLTTHLAANCVGRLIYQTVTISGTSYTGWWLLRAYWSDSNTHDRSQDNYYRAYAGAAIPKYALTMKGLNGRLYSLVTSYGTATNKIITTVGLRPDKIWIYNGNAAVNAGAVIPAQQLYRDFNSTVGSSFFNASLPTYCDIYLCGDYNEDTNLFYLATTDVSGNASTTDFYRFVPYNTEPTYSDYFITGRYYIFLGSSYSTAQYFQLMDQHELYYYDGTNLIRAVDKPKYAATFVDWSE